MNDNPPLREQMWDLVYGLLSEDESQALIGRIKSDPQAARLYAEVKLQSDLVGYAARIEDPSLVLRTTGPSADAKLIKPAAPVVGRRRTKPSAAPVARWHDAPGAGWLAGLVGTALALLLAAGYFWPPPDAQQLAARYVVTEVELPSQLPAGLTREVPIRTRSLGGEGVAAELDVRILGEDGKATFQESVQTSDLGTASVAIPGEALAPGVRLRVAPVEAAVVAGKPVSGPSAGAADTALYADLPVTPEPQLSYFLAEKPVAEQGESSKYAHWYFGAFSKEQVTTQQAVAASPADAIDRFALAFRAQGGEPAAFEAAGMGGYGSARFDNRFGRTEGADASDPQPQPANQPADVDALAGSQRLEMKSTERAAPPASSTPSTTPALSTPPAPAEEPDPASGPARLADSRMRRAPDAVGKLGQTEPPGSAGGVVGRDVDLALSKQLTPAPPVDDLGVLVTDGAAVANVVRAGEAVTFNLSNEAADKKKLLAIAKSGDVPIATREISPGQSLSEADAAGASVNELAKQNQRAVKLELPPEAQGHIDVALFDTTTQPPQIVQREHFYRQAARLLKIDVAGLQADYRPGEQVRFDVQVTDEAGRPVGEAQLGVRVWNEQLARAAQAPPVLLAHLFATAPQNFLADALERETLQRQLGMAAGSEPPRGLDRFSGEQQQGQGQAEAGQAASGQSAGSRRAGGPAAGSQVSGRAAGRESSLGLDEAKDSTPLAASKAAIVEAESSSVRDLGATVESYYAQEPSSAWFTALETPATAEVSNVAAVEAAYDEAVAAAHARRHETQRALGVALLFGGAIGLALLVLLALFRMRSRLRIIVPTLAVAAASVFVGLAWLGWLPKQAERLQIAMTPPAAYFDETAPAPATTASPAAESAAEFSEAVTQDFATQIQDSEATPPETGAAIPSGGGAGQFGDAYGLNPIPAPSDDMPSLAPALPTPAATPQTAGSSPTEPESRSEREEKLAEKSARAFSAKATPSAAAEGDRQNVKLPELGLKMQRDGAESPPAGRALRGKAPQADAPVTESLSSARTFAAPAPPAPPAPANKPGEPAAANPLPAADEGRGVKSLPDQPARPDVKGADVAAPLEKLPEDLERMKKSVDAAGKAETAEAAGKPTSGPPASLHFNPQLVTDENGRATIEFTMRGGDARYLLLIDAVGNGRIGGLQQTIVCKGAANE